MLPELPPLPPPCFPPASAQQPEPNTVGSESRGRRQCKEAVQSATPDKSGSWISDSPCIIHVTEPPVSVEKQELPGTQSILTRAWFTFPKCSSLTAQAKAVLIPSDLSAVLKSVECPNYCHNGPEWEARPLAGCSLYGISGTFISYLHPFCR